MATSAEIAEADRQFAEWMRENLDHAAEQFEVIIAGEPVFGWRLRSIGAPATGHGGPRWLRMVSEPVQWAGGDFWTGNADANTLPPSLPKPCLLGSLEWTEQDWRRQRAELLTLLPGQPCSRTNAPTADLHLPPRWWSALRRTLATLATTPTQRVNADQARVSQRINAAFGDHLDTEVREWETVHGDLHWNNLLQPEFGLLDWEGWGRGPAGLDAATLYCNSLLAPDTAKVVHTTFQGTLCSRSGHLAQLYAVARLLHRITLGDHPALEQPLRDLAASLLCRQDRADEGTCEDA